MVLLLAALAACGGTDNRTGEGAAQEDREAAQPRDELAAHGGRPCPQRLPQAGDHGTGPHEPAGVAPDLPGADRAWVCSYEPRDAGPGPDGQGSAWGWQRTSRPVEVPARDLAALEDRLSQLEPAREDRMCTMDLGPRWMLVLAADGDLTGVVVDGFGCRDVRLTDDPFSTVPGEGGVRGVLTGPDELLGLVQGVGR